MVNGWKDIMFIAGNAAKMENRKSKLITVFYSPLENIYDKDTDKDDMYVHSSNSAQHEKGFHTFLEKFLGMSLPTRL